MGMGTNATVDVDTIPFEFPCIACKVHEMREKRRAHLRTARMVCAHVTPCASSRLIICIDLCTFFKHANA